MRSLRDIIFGIAFAISFVLLLQFMLDPSSVGQKSTYDRSRKLQNHISGDSGGSELDTQGDMLGGGISSNFEPESPPHAQAQASETNSEARRPVLEWGTGQVPTSEILAHVSGWTVFERLYLLNGTLFIVTNEPKKIPDRSLMVSPGYPISDDASRRIPTDKDMQIISPETAASMFGSYASKVEGTSFIVNDPPQFIKHYYHWSAEVIFGLWRAYSSLDPGITVDGHTKLPAPRRIFMAHIPYAEWRDYASMNQWVTRGAFPSISLEFWEDWDDRASMNHPFLLERVVLTDRAASTHSPNFAITQRSVAELSSLASSPYWWSTIRNNLVEIAGGPHMPDAKVITYVSRQGWGRRMLLPEDHQRLVIALEALRDKHGYEVNVVSMDKLSRREQFRLAARTTIMMGIHGNGLTSLLWMKPTHRATVMEFFYPGGFAYDYEWTARALGIKHYGFWDHEYFTSPDLPSVNIPDGFQGNKIPLDGDVVARLCHERLSLPDNSN